MLEWNMSSDEKCFERMCRMINSIFRRHAIIDSLHKGWMIIYVSTGCILDSIDPDQR